MIYHSICQAVSDEAHQVFQYFAEDPSRVVQAGLIGIGGLIAAVLIYKSVPQLIRLDKELEEDYRATGVSLGDMVRVLTKHAEGEPFDAHDKRQMTTYAHYAKQRDERLRVAAQ